MSGSPSDGPGVRTGEIPARTARGRRTLTISLTAPAEAAGSKSSTLALDLPEELLMRFDVGESLGKGGMGEVFRAFDRELEREVAIKFCTAYSNPQACERFMKEAEMMKRIQHSNVVGVLDVGMAEKIPYLVMPLVLGYTLREELCRRGLLQVEEAVRILDQVLDALDAAHHAGVVHRDLKPDNILLAGDGRAMVLDLGVAKSWADGSAAESSSTVSGTPAYMPPEQCRGEPTGLSADLYAAGVILFEMLTGQPPYLAPTAMEVLKAHISSKIPRASEVRPTLDPVWDNVIARALAKSPADRYPDASAFRMALSRAAEGRFLAAGPLAARDLAARSHLTAMAGGPATVVGVGLIGGLLATSAYQLVCGQAFPAVAALLPLFSLFFQEEPGRFKQLTASIDYRMAVYAVTSIFMVALALTTIPEWMLGIVVCWILLAVHLASFGGYHTRDPLDRKGVALHRRANLVTMALSTSIFVSLGGTFSVVLASAATLLAMLGLVRPPARTRHLSVAAATTTILLPALATGHQAEAEADFEEESARATPSTAAGAPGRDPGATSSTEGGVPRRKLAPGKAHSARPRLTSE